MSEAVQPGRSRQETLHAHAQRTRVLLEPGETGPFWQVYSLGGGSPATTTAEGDAILGRPTVAGIGDADHRVTDDRRTAIAPGADYCS